MVPPPSRRILPLIAAAVRTDPPSFARREHTWRQAKTRSIVVQVSRAPRCPDAVLDRRRRLRPLELPLCPRAPWAAGDDGCRPASPLTGLLLRRPGDRRGRQKHRSQFRPDLQRSGALRRGGHHAAWPTRDHGRGDEGWRNRLCSLRSPTSTSSAWRLIRSISPTPKRDRGAMGSR